LRKSYKFAKKKKTVQRYRVNQQIRIETVNLIDENGTMIGETPTREALEMARERGFDLVEVGPKARPPVAKLLDYGQFQYQQEKQLRKQKSKQKKIETKGIRISFKISQHDLETRAKQARKFLDDEQKVKVETILRGREFRHMDLAKEQIRNFVEKLDIPYQIEQDVSKQGNKVFMIIMPEKD
jgi:translation initiation factor IF-3